jgi:hypothetical protein
MHNMRMRLWKWVLIVGILALTGGATYAAVQNDNDGPPLPPDKQARLDKVNALRAALPNHPERKPKGSPPPHPATPEPAPQTGILDMQQTPFPRGSYVIENRWQDFNGRVILQVFAGALYNDESQGIVIERRLQYPSYRELTFRVHQTRTRDGALRVVSARGHRLNLTTKTKKDFVFDADTEAFASP